MEEVKHALLIDDDTDDREIFLMCIKAVAGKMNCLTANNGVEAVAMLESRKEYTPDYIFLDVNMPKMNGIECLRLIKELSG